MFDIGWSEMAVILLVALVVIGPRDLPRVARTMGRWVAKGRAMAREFQTALEDMAREAELDKVKNEIEKAGRTNLGKSIERTIDPTGELGKAFDPNAKDGSQGDRDKAIKSGAGSKPGGAKETAGRTALVAGKPGAAKGSEGGPKFAVGKDAAQGAASTAAKPVEPPAAPPADPGPAASGQEEAGVSRPRATAPDRREAVPADSS